jgi:hypothetical protein
MQNRQAGFDGGAGSSLRRAATGIAAALATGGFL